MIHSDDSLVPAPPGHRSGIRVIDIHGHAGAPKVDALVAGRPEHALAMQVLAQSTGPASFDQNARIVLPRAGQRFASLEARLNDLDTVGIDLQVVSPSPHLYCYWADEALGEDIAGHANEAVRALVGQAPDRLVGLGAVSLQHPERAARQLREVIASGLKGVEISASVGDRELSDPSFAPFWAAAEETGAVIFIHPLGSSLGRRLSQHYLSNTIGQPIETTIALSHMIYSGVFDRHPSLRVVAAHGGGYLPHYIGRSDHAWRVRPEVDGCERPPSSYLSRIWYDTVLFDDASLRHLVDRVGDDKVLFGTDYPFDMAEYDPGRLAQALPEGTREKVLGGNSAALLGL